MTGEEMERAIEFLLKNQADYDTRLDRLSEEVQETSRQLRSQAETQTEFIKVVTQHIEQQAQINAEFRATQARIANALDSLAMTVGLLVDRLDSSTEQR